MSRRNGDRACQGSAGDGAHRPGRPAPAVSLREFYAQRRRLCRNFAQNPAAIRRKGAGDPAPFHGLQERWCRSGQRSGLDLVLQLDGQIGATLGEGGIHDHVAGLDGLLGGGDGGLQVIVGEGGEVLVGDDADAALSETQGDFLAEVGAAGVHLVEEPDEGVADVLQAGGQGDGSQVRAQGQLLVGVNAQEVGLAGLEGGLGGAVAGVASHFIQKVR